MAAKLFVFRFADVEVREREFVLVKSGESLAVEPKAFRVLLVLLRNPGKLIPKQELLDAVWADAAVTENSLARAVGLLRKLLGDEARTPHFIETVATVGYRFMGKVEVVEDAIAVAPSPDPANYSEARGAAGTVSPTLDAKGPAERRISRIGLLFAGAAFLVAGGTWTWYLAKPLPPPRITAYLQLTHDGHAGFIAGTDGTRIYFNSPPALVGVTGGDIVEIPTGFPRAWVMGVAADGANLLILSSDPYQLWTMRAVGGRPRFISSYSGNGGPAWSPDSKYIAYPDSSGNLYKMSSDGTNTLKLATIEGGAITDVTWSPDASMIRFTLNDTLWEVASRGGEPHLLLPDWKGPVGQCCGRWTSDGAFYVFLAGGTVVVEPQVGSFEQIWVLDERRPPFRRVSRKPVQLTSGPIHWGSPTPSRDGNKIFAVGTIPRGELIRIDPKSKQLQPFLGGISAEFLDFSKDRTQIAYVTYPDGILWRARPDGTERVQLTNPPVYPLVCRWSPDGTQILFTALRDASHYGLYMVAARGGNSKLLGPANDGAGQIEGNWSLDGRRIVYGVEVQFSLRILDLDTGKTTKIPGSDGLSSPRWSPDGRYIAAMTVQSRAIRFFDLHTQRWSAPVEQIGGWSFPTWSHDGKFIYALNNVGKWSIQRISVPAGKLESVADLTNVHFTGALGPWFGLDINDNPLFLRDNGTSDVYALAFERK
jgi:DNA-binding winged helix-turn-helix (wHTH) protein/Tol biopolymer transport system component